MENYLRPRAAAVTAAYLLRSHNKAHSSQLVLQKTKKVHPKVRNHGEGPYWAFSWLKAATTAFTFKTLLRHYAKGR